MGRLGSSVYVSMYVFIFCCNKFLNGQSLAVVEKLQRVQNACARVIGREPGPGLRMFSAHLFSL